MRTLEWKNIQKRVWRIQIKIYNFSLKNDKSQVIKLQKILINSLEAKILAVRRVTQDNHGKAIASVDNLQALAPAKRLSLARDLKIDGKNDLIKRILTSKSGDSNKFRLSRISTIRDKAKQALAVLALEPEWEAKFEKNSYGFRPGRRPHDAIEAIHSSINKSPKYVLEGGIQKCFDQIDHKLFLDKLDTYPLMRKQVQIWLEAKIVVQNREMFSNKIMSQGGTIFPLLANIALHGIETFLSDWIAEIPAFSPGGHRISKPNRRKRLLFVRYADNFVVLHPDKEIIDSVKSKIEQFLSPMGLKLHPEKIKIGHTYLKLRDRNPGFEFLGFWIRTYQVGKKRRGKRGFEYKTFIRPHSQNISEVLNKTKTILRESKDVTSIVTKLNPIIRSWANYFSTVASKRTFSAMDEKLMIQLMNWSKRKHPRKTLVWIRNKYLNKDIEKGRKRLRFGYLDKDQKINGIYYFAETPINRHTKIIGAKSIYDNDLVYWSARGRPLGNQFQSELALRLLKTQEGCCKICGLKLLPGDDIRVDYIKLKKFRGKDKYKNFHLFHGHCHDLKSEKE